MKKIEKAKNWQKINNQYNYKNNNNKTILSK